MRAFIRVLAALLLLSVLSQAVNVNQLQKIVGRQPGEALSALNAFVQAHEHIKAPQEVVEGDEPTGEAPQEGLDLDTTVLTDETNTEAAEADIGTPNGDESKQDSVPSTSENSEDTDSEEYAKFFRMLRGSCEDSTCQNGGVCGEDGQCVCPPGFEGATCESQTGTGSDGSDSGLSNCGTAVLEQFSAKNCVFDTAFVVDDDLLSYSCTVPPETVDVVVLADGVAGSRVTIDNDVFMNLEFGQNAGTIDVECLDSTQQYTLTVTRKFPDVTCDASSPCSDEDQASICAGRDDCCTVCFGGKCQPGKPDGELCLLPDVTLSNLELSNGCTIDDFSPTTYYYKCTVNSVVTTVYVKATANDPNAHIEILGHTQLTETENTIEVKLTNANQWTPLPISLVYTVTVLRSDLADYSGDDDDDDDDGFLDRRGGICKFEEDCLRYDMCHADLECCSTCVHGRCQRGLQTTLGGCVTENVDCTELAKLTANNGCKLPAIPLLTSECTVPSSIVGLDIVAQPLYNHTNVDITGDKDFVEGENEIEIAVSKTCEGVYTVKIYKIIVTREKSEKTKKLEELRAKVAAEKREIEPPAPPPTREEAGGPLNVYVHKGEAVTLAVHKPGDPAHVKYVTFHPKPGDANVVEDCIDCDTPAHSPDEVAGDTPTWDSLDGPMPHGAHIHTVGELPDGPDHFHDVGAPAMHGEGGVHLTAGPAVVVKQSADSHAAAAPTIAPPMGYAATATHPVPVIDHDHE